MAIDFGVVLNKVTEIQGKVGDLYKVVGIAKDGAVSIPTIGNINFTTAQKTALVNKYNSIKGDLTTLFSQLP